MFSKWDGVAAVVYRSIPPLLQGDQGDDGAFGPPGKAGARGKVGVVGLPGDQGAFGPKVCYKHILFSMNICI